MASLFLTTILSCSQINGLIYRIQATNLLSSIQKIEIIKEFKKVVPTCPVFIENKPKK